MVCTVVIKAATIQGVNVTGRKQHPILITDTLHQLVRANQQTNAVQVVGKYCHRILPKQPRITEMRMISSRIRLVPLAQSSSGADAKTNAFLIRRLKHSLITELSVRSRGD
ncbi:hypothetical protein Mapa_016315 [Marchantia paleacea]|nr:hypothetical protein Mapa_016315 [Marchantia paleacea]